MPRRSGPIALSLRDLHAEVELSRPVCEAVALAASVALDHHQGRARRDVAVIHEDDSQRPAKIERVPVDDRARDTFADLDEAAEKGAEAIALMLARRVLGRVVFRRLPTCTGADYLMRDPQAPDGDGYERLECSGIGVGKESATTRLRSKLEQLARYPSYPSGRAVVTHFRTKPVEIRVGSFRR